MVEIQAISVPEENAPRSSCIYYPLWFVQFAVSWRRLLFPKRRESVWVCVDGVRGVAHRVDVFPPTSTLRVADSDILPLVVDRGDALKKARVLVDWWARTRLFTWWSPVSGQREIHLLHKVYLIERESSRKVLRDSVTGERDFF